MMDSISMGHHHQYSGAYYTVGGGGQLSRNTNMATSNQQQQQHHQSSFEVWNNFFLSAGIPANVAQDYAITFSQHRIRIDMLKEITKDILLDMGIKAMGDIIAILRQAKSICTQNELKPSGLVKLSAATSTMAHVNHKAPDQSTTTTANNNSGASKQLSQRMPITTNRGSSLNLAPASSSVGGNKIQSRLNLSSGAVIASSSSFANNNDNDNPNRRSTISNSLAKRLKPLPNERKPKLEEKTLTVHYPPTAAIAKAAQRISGGASKVISNQSLSTSKSSSIKSRLGSVSTSTPARHTDGYRSKADLRTISKNTPSASRRHDSSHSRDRLSKSSNNRHAKDKSKSTVFSRLDRSAR